MGHVFELPVELFEVILWHLSSKQIVACCRVCPQWKIRIENLCTMQWARRHLSHVEGDWRFDEGGWEFFRECVYSVHRMRSGRPRHVVQLPYNWESIEEPMINEKYVVYFAADQECPTQFGLHVFPRSRDRPTNRPEDAFMIEVWRMELSRSYVKDVIENWKSVCLYGDYFVARHTTPSLPRRSDKAGEGRLLCYDLSEGSLLWVHRTACYEPFTHVGKNTPNSLPLIPFHLEHPAAVGAGKLCYSSGEWMLPFNSQRNECAYNVVDIRTGRSLLLHPYLAKQRGEDELDIAPRSHGACRGVLAMDSINGHWFARLTARQAPMQFSDWDELEESKWPMILQLEFLSTTTGERLAACELPYLEAEKRYLSRYAAEKTVRMQAHTLPSAQWESPTLPMTQIFIDYCTSKGFVSWTLHIVSHVQPKGSCTRIDIQPQYVDICDDHLEIGSVCPVTDFNFRFGASIEGHYSVLESQESTLHSAEVKLYEAKAPGWKYRKLEARIKHLETERENPRAGTDLRSDVVVCGTAAVFKSRNEILFF